MKTKIPMIILALGITFSIFCQSVGINQTGAAPHSSAILDVESTSKGFLLPRMTTAERNAISSPADGLMIFNTTTECLNYYISGEWYKLSGILEGSISTLDCSIATNAGNLTIGIPAVGVSSSIPYTGGNGGFHNGDTANSTGVTGLTATLAEGSLANGNGTLLYMISGTPASSGTASFDLFIGGQTCILTRTVNAFVCGSSSIDFIYNGSQVTYGTVLGANNKCWLDRNLGATQVATSSADEASYGHLFQWGRLDDGHQVRTSSTTTSLSNSDVPGHENFILTPFYDYNWRHPPTNYLWQGVNGINNPCPDGYRLPTQAEWDVERASWNTNNAAGAFGSSLKLPMAGYRHFEDGLVLYEGSQGLYWSSSVNDEGAWSQYFDSDGTQMIFNWRAFGFSARCLKD